MQEIGEDYHYGYEKPEKSEMMFTNPKNDVEEIRSTGTQATNITMKNKNVEYFIWRNFRGDDGADVSVSKNNKTFADIYCDLKREVHGLL